MLSSFQLNLSRCSSRFVHLSNQMKQLNKMKQYEKVMNLYEKHCQQDIPTDTLINETLQACTSLKNLKFGMKIHQNLSLQCGALDQAQVVFNQIENKTPIIYNTIVNGLADNDRLEEALKILKEMSCSPNEYLYGTIFKICAQINTFESFEFGESMFNQMSFEYQKNSFVMTSALHMFMQNKQISFGERLFDKIPKTSYTYGVMMSGYLKTDQPDKAVQMFLQIKDPDEIKLMLFFNACARLKHCRKTMELSKRIFAQYSSELIKNRKYKKAAYAALDMFIKFDEIQNVENLFNQLEKDIVCYGSMMKMYNEHDQGEKALELYERMKIANLKPNEIICILLINACARVGDFSICEKFVSEIPRNYLSNIWIKNALIDMWGKAGSPKQAEQLFKTIKQPDIISFTAMINSYGLNGMGTQAVELFHRIPFNMLDELTYTCILNACSHSGLIDEARRIFDKIETQKKSEFVYTTMIDVFSRCHLTDEAQHLIDEFEQTHSPYLPMYMAILSAARNQRDSRLAQKLFDRMKQIFPNCKDNIVSAAILLSNTYALSSDFSTASHIRTKLNQSGHRKIAGLSSTVVNGKIVKFRAHDRSHPEANEIYAELDRITKELLEHGHTFDASWITRPMMEDETIESLLCGHSEKLAIAFNFIQQPIPSPIQITKNLRVCGDCHSAIKLIAKIRKRSIIVRDANRIHHFNPTGQCSCQDHF